ncbi:MAG: hypothetical protein ACI9K2_006343, partial [Myxococcota bacterium]
MPLPDDFHEQSLYHSDRWYLHELIELDPEAGLVVAVMDTERLTDWVADQRPWPGHPGHVPGAVVVQAT